MESRGNIVWLRRAELALATLILVYGVLFHNGYFSGEAPDNVLVEVSVIYGGLFLLPLALAIVSLLSAIVAESTVRSYLTGAVATVILLGVLGSWAMFFFPSSGGGVQVGHLLSFAFGLLLAVVVLFKQTTLRLQPHLAELRQ